MTYEHNKKVMADAKAHPEKYLPHTEKADKDRVNNFGGQIEDKKAEIQQLQRELDAHPEFSPEEKTKRKRAIAALQKRVDNMIEMSKDPSGPSGAR
jgi:hypothetical protein